MRFVSRLLIWLFYQLCVTYSTLAQQIGFPIADVAPWFALINLQYIGLLDSSPHCLCAKVVPWLAMFVLVQICLLDSCPDCLCCFLAGFVRLSVHWLSRFVSRLLVWFLGLLCSTCRRFAYQIRLLIDVVAPWFALFDFQYIGLIDSSPDCCCGSLA